MATYLHKFIEGQLQPLFEFVALGIDRSATQSFPAKDGLWTRVDALELLNAIYAQGLTHKCRVMAWFLTRKDACLYVHVTNAPVDSECIEMNMDWLALLCEDDDVTEFTLTPKEDPREPLNIVARVAKMWDFVVNHKVSALPLIEISNDQAASMRVSLVDKEVDPDLVYTEAQPYPSPEEEKDTPPTKKPRTKEPEWKKHYDPEAEGVHGDPEYLKQIHGE